MATIWRPLLDLTHRFSTLYLTAASKFLTLGRSSLKSQRIRILSSETRTSTVLSTKARVCRSWTFPGFTQFFHEHIHVQ
jgi:hypothetical protein